MVSGICTSPGILSCCGGRAGGAERWIPTVVAILSGLMTRDRRMFVVPRCFAPFCFRSRLHFVLPSATLLALDAALASRFRVRENPDRRDPARPAVVLAESVWLGPAWPLAPAFAVPWVIGLERRLRRAWARARGAAVFVALGSLRSACCAGQPTYSPAILRPPPGARTLLTSGHLAGLQARGVADDLRGGSHDTWLNF
jgi:hypothetical protein